LHYRIKFDRSSDYVVMEFRIADTFTGSLGRLTAQEQKAAKTTAFDLQLNAAAPGLSFHKLDRAQDKSFWSVRVNADIRIIVHRTSASLLLVYVDHHDDAYRWAERRRIERHPTTGAMQIVELRERVHEIDVFVAEAEASQPATPKRRLFDNLGKLELMQFGVPADWVEAVRSADEDSLFDVAAHLPQEAQEALLKLAVGETPEPPKPTPADADPFSHPDARRRFRLLTDAEALERALEFPWEKWSVFLHPDQTALVERSFSGPVRVSGSAGTGKTVVALHRAVHLARSNPEASILLTTFSNPLANALRQRVEHLVGNETQIASRINVASLPRVGWDLYTRLHGEPNIASLTEIRSLLVEAAGEVAGANFTPQFLCAEWAEVVDAWQLRSREAYAEVPRLGRKTRLGAKQRELLWTIFELVRARLDERGAVTWNEIFTRLSVNLTDGAAPPFDFAVVDEAQDLGVAQARFFGALCSGRPNALFFSGDLGQRIFQLPFSWKSVGLDIRGRSYSLRVNYRTSHQIRTRADALLPSSVSDVDGNEESRHGAVSVFDGPAPEVVICDGEDEESGVVAGWIGERLAEDYHPNEIGVFVRTDSQIPRALATVKTAQAIPLELTDEIEVAEGRVAVSTMHRAKGLEFRAVVVMACDDEVLPLQERIETVSDAADLEEVYNTERHLLYVACTRARDRLLITGVEPASEFLGDLQCGK
jgi:hypothetical protein